MKTSRKRSSRRRSYKKVYYIVTEGKTTEPSYFRIVGSYIPHDEMVAIFCQAADASSISSILKKVKALAEHAPHERDEIWAVIDQDPGSHLPEQFAKLKGWENLSRRHHVAVSVPRFEYWLLCHFEDSPDRNDSMHDDYVARYLPGYNRKKDLTRHRSKITVQCIRHAIDVASRSPLDSYDSPYPGSDVWKLVKDLVPGK